jgi:hypothetical protein
METVVKQDLKEKIILESTTNVKVGREIEIT